MKKIFLGIVILLTFLYCKKENSETSNPTPNNSTISDRPTIFMPDKGRVTETVIMRGGPGKDYDKISCNEFGKTSDGSECYSGCFRTTNQLEPGTEVEILEKSKIVKVDKWENRWLKVRLNGNFNCETDEIWIFGEFVK